MRSRIGQQYNTQSVSRLDAKATTTGSIAAGATLGVLVAWPAGAWPDTSYVAVADVYEATSASTLRVRRIRVKSTTTVEVSITNDDALNARTGTVTCMAFAAS